MYRLLWLSPVYLMSRLLLIVIFRANEWLQQPLWSSVFHIPHVSTELYCPYYVFYVFWTLFFGHIVLFTKLHFPMFFFDTSLRPCSDIIPSTKISLNTIYQLPILEHLMLSLGFSLSFMSICTFLLNCGDSNLELL